MCGGEAIQMYERARIEEKSPTDGATVGPRPPARALASHTFQIASRYVKSTLYL